jgi:ketosteroid isomerase-like protein
MKADAKTEAAVKAVLDKLVESYTRRDLALLRSCIASDPDVVMYGTGADEKRLGLAQVELQAKRDWSQSDETSLSFSWISISAAGPVAWVAADTDFNLKAGGQSFNLPARTTFVLEKRGDKWLIMQTHFSFPAESQAEGESFPT